MSKSGAVAIEDLPPTFPMRPYDMQMELCEEVGYEIETDSGYRRYAPVQPGEWRLQPKYNRSVLCLCDVDSNRAFTQGLITCSPTWADAMMDTLGNHAIPQQVRWIEGLRLYQTGEMNTLNGALIVADFVHESMPHSERRKLLEDIFPILGIRQKPNMGEVYLVPEFTEHVSVDLWLALHAVNEEWETNFYNGVIGKRNDALYHIQTDDQRKHSLSWLSYKFQS